MIKQNELSKRFSRHCGHRVEIVQDGSSADALFLECEDCCEVILNCKLSDIPGRLTENRSGRAFVMRELAAEAGRFDEVYAIVMDNILALARTGQAKAPLADILPTEEQYAEHGLGVEVRVLFFNEHEALDRLAPLLTADGFKLRTEAGRVSTGKLTEWYVSW